MLDADAFQRSIISEAIYLLFTILLTANSFRQLLKTYLFAEYFCAYSALEVLHIMRYIYKSTYLLTTVRLSPSQKSSRASFPDTDNRCCVDRLISSQESRPSQTCICTLCCSSCSVLSSRSTCSSVSSLSSSMYRRKR